MTDVSQSKDDRKKGNITRAIIISGWAITLVTMVAIIGMALVTLWRGASLPQELGQWASLALGFLFGTFTNIVREYIAD